MCALSLPTAYSGEGLPTSIQIVLPAGQEGFAVKMGSALEAALGISVRPKL
jgi:Asp-tRNA(Asn)/Glu-tRNA(Gln) amidotransferase A subunit family amidase